MNEHTPKMSGGKKRRRARHHRCCEMQKKFRESAEEQLPSFLFIPTGKKHIPKQAEEHSSPPAHLPIHSIT